MPFAVIKYVTLCLGSEKLNTLSFDSKERFCVIIKNWRKLYGKSYYKTKIELS